MSETAGRLPVELPPSGVARWSNDATLARRAAAGDQRAFAAIFKRHHQELYRYCRAILRDPDDAQDALQATMVKALRALPGEEREIALKPWLFRIAHNEAISIARARRNPAALDPEAPDPHAAPEEEAATRERLRELVHDLDQLPERQRGSLVMRELSGLSFEEIGRVFSFSAAAAKQAVYEARVGLQEIAEGRAMECDSVREAISAQDRRVLRARRIRAHLRGCERCSDFEAAIGRRQSDLALLAPPIAAPAALAAVQAALGGSAAGGGAAVGAGVVGAGLGGGVALKTAAAVLATAAIAGGAAELSGVVDIDGSKNHEGAPATAPAAPAPAQESGAPAAGANGASGGASQSRSNPGGARGADGGTGRHHNGDGGRGGGNSAGHGQASAPGQATAPGQTTSPGNPGSAPGQTTSPGNSADAPGQTGSAAGQSGSTGGSQGASSNASATGQASSSAAGSNASASGQTYGGGTGTAPGQTDASPAHYNAPNSANAADRDE